tara:strand:+ start:521 stop:709 length:189 start_codon:yes stop_codon:yes gene_type:complete
MAKGVFEAWELADINRMLKAEKEKREQREEEAIDPESRLLQEALMLAPPTPEKAEMLNSLLE